MWVIWCSQGNSPFLVLKVIRSYAREYNEILKKQLALDPVQTYPDIFESATFSFRIQKCPRPHVSVFKSNLPVHTCGFTLIPTPLGVLPAEHASEICIFLCLWLGSMRFQIHSVFKNFHSSGEQIQKVADSCAGFTGYVWAEAVSGKKKLRVQKYRDTCGHIVDV